MGERAAEAGKGLGDVGGQDARLLASIVLRFSNRRFGKSGGLVQ
jgi:hypothetical protein